MSRQRLSRGTEEPGLGSSREKSTTTDMSPGTENHSANFDTAEALV